MAEIDNIADDQKEVVAGGGSGSGSEHKSPWKMPVTEPVDSPVMGAGTWPALSDVQRTETSSSSATDSKTSAGPQKPQGGGNGSSSHKHEQSHHLRSRSKRNQNGMPPFPVSVPYTQPVVPNVYPPMRPILPHIPVQAYGYQPMPAAFPEEDNQLSKSGTQIPMQAFGPPVHVHGMGPRTNSQPPVRAVNPSNYLDRRHNVPEASRRGGRMYPGWRYQRPLRPRDGSVMQQHMAPGAYMRPAVYGPAPFAGGPPFPGTGPMYYPPIPPPGSISATFLPQFATHVVNPLVPVLPSETMALREKIVKQIEYYFSDENLPTDHYLISRMDDRGWVPISIIADFRRVKMISTNIEFILDALKSSQSVEIQGQNVRRRDNWSKYVVVSPSKCIDYTTTNVKNNSSCIRSLPIADSSSGANSKAEGAEVLPNSAAKVDDISNDFGSTLMLDEELGKEQKKGMEDLYSVSSGLYHYNENEDQKEPLKMQRFVLEAANVDKKPAQAMNATLVV